MNLACNAGKGARVPRLRHRASVLAPNELLGYLLSEFVFIG